MAPQVLNHGSGEDANRNLWQKKFNHRCGEIEGVVEYGGYCFFQEF